MSLFTKTAEETFAPYNSDGTTREIVPQEAQVWGTEVERLITAFQAGGGIIFETKAEMDASLNYAANQAAWVMGDPTVGNNGVYRKIGASGSGSWDRRGDLPYPFIPATDVGAGTPNAIQATSAIPVSESALIWVKLFEANTGSPVTISFNGGAALTIRTNVGNDPVAGGLSGILLGRIDGTTFRLVSDQTSAAVLAAAEAAAAAAQAAANSNYMFDTVAQASAASIPAAINSIFVRGRDAADDGIISVYVDTNNGSTDTFASSGGDARTWYLVEESPKLRYNVGKPWVSAMERFRTLGITPEDVDTGNEIGNDADAAIPLREMFGQGIADGITHFRLKAGRTYNIASYDPSGTGNELECIGVLLKNQATDIFFDRSGAVLKAFDTIRSATAIAANRPGAIIRYESSDTTEGGAETQRLHLKAGKLDLTGCTPSTPNVPTIGGEAVVGRWILFHDHPIADHGITAPSGNAIGVGGGDQSWFYSNLAYFYLLNAVSIGPPDLALYLSNSGIKRGDVDGLFVRRAGAGAVGLKRFASGVSIRRFYFEECLRGIYNPTADGLTNNMGGRMHISNGVMVRTQERPIDINANADYSTVDDVISIDHGRRISDGAELSASERMAVVRCRSRYCEISNVRGVLKDWSLSATSGKEQIGLSFGFNGDMALGAEDCYHHNNFFKGLFQKVRYDANTARNRGRNDRGVSISVSDTDAADNIFQHRMVDQSMVTFVPSSNRTIIHIEAQTTSAGSPNVMVHCNTTGSPAIANFPSGMATPANITLTTGVTTVDGGTASNFTVSCVNDGTVRLINRTGGTLLLRVTEPSR